MASVILPLSESQFIVQKRRSQFYILLNICTSIASEREKDECKFSYGKTSCKVENHG